MKIEKVFSKRLQQEVWKIDVTISGYRMRRADFSTKREAQEAIAALRTKMRALRYGLTTGKPDITLGELRAKCEADPTCSAKFAVSFNLFVESVGAMFRLTDLARAHLATFQTELKARELRPATINTYMTGVSAALHRVPLFFSDLDDWQPPRMPRRMPTQSRARVLTREELSQIFTVLAADRLNGERSEARQTRRELYDIARLMLLTGARREMIVKIKATDIDWRQCEIVLESSKVKRRQRLPLSALALTILEERAAGKGAHLFKPIDSSTVSNALARIGEAAKAAYGQHTEGGWTLHDFRRTAATVVENAGIPYSAVAALLGHKRKDMTSIYTVAQMESLRQAVKVLEDWCRGIEGFTHAHSETCVEQMAA